MKDLIFRDPETGKITAWIPAPHVWPTPGSEWEKQIAREQAQQLTEIMEEFEVEKQIDGIKKNLNP